MTYSNVTTADQNCNIHSPAQLRHICGMAQAYAYGLAVPRHLRAAWREEFMRRWDAEDDTPINIADISAKVIARVVEAVPAMAPDPVNMDEQEGNPHAPRGPPPIDLNAIAKILFPNLSLENQTIIAAGAFQLLAGVETDFALAAPAPGLITGRRPS